MRRARPESAAGRASAPSPRGRFVTFEGVEGSGKSTQIRRAAAWLSERGWQVVVTREPGGTALGVRIRNLLLHSDGPVAPLTELLLFAADRAQHMAERVEPALKSGCIVLCDRHADSLVAYQAFGRGLDRGLVSQINRIATPNRKPDLTIVLDLDPAVGLSRARARGQLERLKGRDEALGLLCFQARGHGELDRLERESLAFHERVREGFLAIGREEPDRVTVIDGERPPDAVWHDVVQVLKERLALEPFRDGSQTNPRKVLEE